MQNPKQEMLVSQQCEGHYNELKRDTQKLYIPNLSIKNVKGECKCKHYLHQ